MIDRATLSAMAARASTLAERLEPPFDIDPPELHADAIETRLARWAALAAKGDRSRLERTLQWRGVDLDRARPALGAVRLAADAPLPEWAIRFDDLIAEAATHGGAIDASSEFPFIDPADPLPFELIAAPFVRVGASRLQAAVSERTRSLVTPAALTTLHRTLLTRVARLSAGVLALGYHGFEYVDAHRGGDASTRLLRFAQLVYSDPVPTYLIEYPVLARLVTLACDNWLSATVEFLERFTNDRQAIVERLLDGRDPGVLSAITIGDADVHDGHRHVAILEFESGARAVYKPRNLDLDAGFQSFLSWLNAHGLSTPLRVAGVLSRGDYGWAEFVPHRPASSGEERERFYQRMGALAAVAYALGSTDLHYGNLIADGEHPIVIDLETLLSARPKAGAVIDRPGATAPPPPARWTVLQSFLLPNWSRVQGIYIDRSAMGASYVPGAAEQLLCHTAPNEPLEPLLKTHASAIETGFREAYDLLLRHRAELLDVSGPLASLQAQPIRIVMRETWVYFALLRQSIDPAALRDGVDRDITLERLHLAAGVSDTPPPFLTMIAPEQRSLRALDIPRFEVMSDDTSLRDAHGVVVPGMMEDTAVADVRARLAAMSAADADHQCARLRLTLVARYEDPAAWAGARDEMYRVAVTEPDPQTLIETAERIARDLIRQSDMRDGRRVWRGLGLVHAHGRLAFADPSDGFADGALGIAVFLAALARVTRSAEWRHEAISLLRQPLEGMERMADDVRRVPPGLASGLGGLVAAAALAGQLLDEAALIDGAVKVVRLFGGRAIANTDTTLADGTAGLAAGLDVVLRVRPDTDVRALRDRIDAIALPLLVADADLRTAIESLAADAGSPDAIASLRDIAQRPLPGVDTLAFGTAGEIDALIWAARRSGDPDLRKAAVARAAAMLARASGRGFSLVPSHREDALHMPGLVAGLAGIGYALLRTAAPGDIPSLAVLDSGAAPQTETLDQHMTAALAPLRDEHLISRATIASVCERSASAMPAAMSGFFGFETRLDDPAPTADFLVRTAGEDDEWRALEGFAAQKDDACWQRIASFVRARRDVSSPLHGAVHNMWLEFDLAAPEGSHDIPSVFFGTEKLTAGADTAWVEDAIVRLAGRAVTAAQRDCMVRIVHSFDPGSEANIFQVGMMLSRADAPLRLCVIGVPVAEVPKALEKFGWTGDGANAAVVLDEFGSLVDRVALDFDVDADAGLLQRLGIEMYLDLDANYGARLMKMIDLLRRRGLCLPEKAGGLVAWGGLTHQRRHLDIWPKGLLAQARQRPDGASSTFSRWVHHVKFGLRPDRPLAVKAYLAVAHAFVTDEDLRRRIESARSTTPS